jgi:hypothetical protein
LDFLRKTQKKYDEFKKLRQIEWKKVLPIFENWYEIDSKNIDCLKILSGINNVIGNDEISKNYQAKIYDLESN